MNNKTNRFLNFINYFSSESLGNYYRFLERPDIMKKIKIGCFVTIALFIALAFFIPKPHEYAIESLEKIPFFYSIFGFVACVGIVIVAKIIGHFLLERKEDYYD